MARVFQVQAAQVSGTAALKAVWWTLNGMAVRRLTRPGKAEPVDPKLAESPPLSRAALRRAWLEPFIKDARDVATGLYPPSERMATPAYAFTRALDFLSDARRVDRRRRRQGGGVEVRDALEAKSYPAYYRQNFHFQSDGWFSAESAARYEAQVEALFSGAAGGMRRRALSLLAKAWRGVDQRDLVVLDLACGSGAFLVDLKAAFPRAQVFGVDLSEAYARHAAKTSSAPVSIANAERLPFADQSLDAISCIYLFHETPPRYRLAIAREIARVLKPGGYLAFADSVQASDTPGLERLLAAFPAFFHEPFYESYQKLDIAALFTEAGLAQVAEDQAFLTKARLFAKE